MLGARGLAAGVAASTIMAAISLASQASWQPAALLGDLAVIYMAGAVLGFLYGALDKLLFFVKRSWKAEGFLLAIAALLALNGRGSLLVGQQLYSAMLSAISHPLLGDLLASLAATGLWGIPMVLIHAAITPRKKAALPRLSIPSLKPPASPKPLPTPPGPPPGYVICPVCGAENEPENKYCKKCGAPLPRLQPPG